MLNPSLQLQGNGEGRWLLVLLREGQMGLPYTSRYCEASEPAQFLGHLSSPWKKEEEISLAAG